MQTVNYTWALLVEIQLLLLNLFKNSYTGLRINEFQWVHVVKEFDYGIFLFQLVELDNCFFENSVVFLKFKFVAFSYLQVVGITLLMLYHILFSIILLKLDDQFLYTWLKQECYANQVIKKLFQKSRASLLLKDFKLIKIFS